MKLSLKRIVAMLCVLTMIAGIGFVGDSQVIKASDATNATEWSIASQVGDITSTDGKVGNIYHSVDSLNIQLDGNKTEDCYALYIKVDLRGEEAVANMKEAQVELANTKNEVREICWILNNEELNLELTEGVNELYLPLDKAIDASAEGQGTFSHSDTINWFRIFNVDVSDCTGVILDDVKIIDVTPIIKPYSGATATVAPEEGTIPAGCVFAGWYTDATCTKVLSGTTTDTVYAKFVDEDILSLKTQYTCYKSPEMLADCDSKVGQATVTNMPNASITTLDGEYKEGVGALKLTEANIKRAHFTITETDITAYLDEYLHFWFYIDNPANLTDELIIDLGNDDTNYRRWIIYTDTLKEGWNEIYLDFATKVGEADGESANQYSYRYDVGTVDFTKVTYFKIHQLPDQEYKEMTTIVDDIRLVESLPGKMITRCNNKADCKTEKMGSWTADLTNCKEGTGSFVATTTGQVDLAIFTLTQSVNISEYQEGYIHLWVKIDDPTKLGDCLNIQINDANEGKRIWYLEKEQFISGWNEVYLDLQAAIGWHNTDKILAIFDYSLDFSCINGVKLFQQSSSNNSITVVLDDIRAVEDLPDKVITNCEDGDDITSVLGDITLKAGEHKEGTGAFKATSPSSGTDPVLSNFNLNTGVNISDYTDGYLHLWVYIDKPEKLNTWLAVDIGNSSNQCHRWYLRKGQLQSGWNELYLSLTTGETNELIEYNWECGTGALSNGTVPNWSNVTYFKLHNDTKTEVITTIVDDIRVVHTAPNKVITNCNSKDNITSVWGYITSEAEEYKEGTGAFKATSSSDDTDARLSEFALNTGVNISDYTDGYLHLWVYIDKPENLKTWLAVDIGNSSNQCHRWFLRKGQLQSGWNELYLDLTTGETNELIEHNWECGTGALASGTVPDWSNVTYFKLHNDAKNTEAITTIVDDIYVVSNIPEAPEAPENYADLRFVTTVDSKYYKNVGFEITIGGKTKEMYSNKVYSTLYGASDDSYVEYLPSVFAIQSTYFKAHTLTGIPYTAYDTEISARPFWTTQDGTKVYGTGKTCTINEEMVADTVEQDLHVVISSDIHYTDENYYTISPDTRLQHWVDSILAEHEKDPIDLLVVNGDISLDFTSTGGSYLASPSVNRSEAFVSKYVSQLREYFPVYVMPGNHEQYDDEDWYQIAGNYRQGSMVIDNTLFLFLDTYKVSETATSDGDGTYTGVDMQYVNQMMSQYPDMDVYLISHYFAHDAESDDFKELMFNDRVKGLFHGHEHSASVKEISSDYNSKSVARTGNFSYYFDDGADQPFWGFRELMITSDLAYSQYISVDSPEGCSQTHQRTTMYPIWY